VPIFCHMPLLHSFIEYAVLRYEQYIARCPLKQEAPVRRTGLVNVPENYGSAPDTRKGHHSISGAAPPKM